MSTVNNVRSVGPVYYHREYKNDIDQPAPADDSWLGACQRVGTVALPFLSLYKPVSFPLSLVMGGLRTWTCITHFLVTLEKGETCEIGYAALQTAIAIVALSGTIFAHPLGMLITTGQDLVVELSRLVSNLNAGEYQKAMENCLSIVNNALYFALFLDGGLKLAIASFAVQILIGLYHSHSEFMKGRYLEAAGHLGMSLIRCHQLNGAIKLLPPPLEKGKATDSQQLSNVLNSHHKHKLTDEQLMEKAKATGNHELIDVLNRYHKQGNFEPAIYNSLEKGDWAAAEILIKNHAKVEYGVSGPAGYVPPVLAVALRADNVPASLFEQLLKNGATVNYPTWGINDYQRTYKGNLYPGVIFAGDKGRFDLMELLLRYGANPNVRPLLKALA